MLSFCLAPSSGRSLGVSPGKYLVHRWRSKAVGSSSGRMLMHNKERERGGELLKAGLGGGESVEDEPLFAEFDYYLDESDPDLVILRRQDGAFVAAFSAQGATREGIAEATKEDYGRLIEANADLLDLRGEGDRKRSA
jgi:hypothetical protein